MMPDNGAALSLPMASLEDQGGERNFIPLYSLRKRKYSARAGEWLVRRSSRLQLADVLSGHGDACCCFRPASDFPGGPDGDLVLKQCLLGEEAGRKLFIAFLCMCSSCIRFLEKLS